MSLFRRHKDKKPFEEQLEQQLGDMEYKPSESLWDRIDSGMSSDGFEQPMRQKLDQFEQIPYSGTWDKIANRLPAEKAPVRRYALFVMASAVLLVSVATGYFISQKNRSNQTVELIKPEGVGANTPSMVENIQEIQTERVSTPVQKPMSSAPVQVEQEKVQPNDSEKKTLRVSRSVPSNPVVLNANTQTVQTSAPRSLAKTASTPHKDVHSGGSNPPPPVLAVAPSSSPAQSGSAGVSQHKPVTQSETIQTHANDSPTVPTASVSQKADSTMAISGREISGGVLAQKDSTPTSSSADHQDENPDELTRFSISVFGGASLSGTTYSSPKNSSLNFDENINLRKQIERPTVDWSGGFMLDYRLNDRWMVSSGIMMVNFNQKVHYDLDSAVSPANPADIGAPVVNPGDSFLVGNAYSNRIRYTWTEIPLLVNYTLHRGARWDIDLQGGVGYAFISTIDGGMVSYDNKGVLVLKDKESFPQISNTIFVTFQPQISKRFGQGVSLGLVPSFKYSVTSIIGNETWIQQHPYFIGLSACLRKRF